MFSPTKKRSLYPEWKLLDKQKRVLFLCSIAVLVLLLFVFSNFSKSVNSGDLDTGTEDHSPAIAPHSPPIVFKQQHDGNYWLAGTKLLIVVNFFEGQIERLLQTMTTWKKFQPCDPTNPDVSKFVDLMFYTSVPLSDAARYRIEDFLSLEEDISTCFGEITFRSADLTPEQNVYSTAHSEMFGQLMVHYRVDRPYNFIFNLEPDVFALRSEWLSLLLKETESPPGFWVKGSAPREPDAPNYTRGEFFPHINGNALYRYDSPEFMDFVVKCKYSYRNARGSDGKPSESLDMSMYYYLFENRLFHMFHRFIFSEFVQNHPVGSVREVVETYPNTFLVHGSEWIPKIQKYLADESSESERT